MYQNALYKTFEQLANVPDSNYMDDMVTVIDRPKNSSQFSCNWKSLSKNLITANPPKSQHKKGPQQCDFKSRKLTSFNASNLTKCLAIDCEFVGVGYNGQDNHLAKVSIVNQLGECIYDTYVKPREKITNFRSNITGISINDLLQGKDFKIVQKEVADLLKDRIIVGHALKNDLKVLYLNHPQKLIRDTSRHKYFCQKANSKHPSLKKLAKIFLDMDIQQNIHDSVEDAKATMALYMLRKKEWEKDLKLKKT